MKRWLRIFLLMLAAVWLVMGRAEENRLFTRELDAIQSACSAGGTLYVCLGDEIYAYDAATATEDTYAFEKGGMKEIRLFSARAELYALARNDAGEALLGSIALSEGRAEFRILSKPDWNAVQREMHSEEDVWPRQVVGCGDFAVFAVQQGWQEGGLFVLNLTSGTIAPIAGAELAHANLTSSGDSAILLQSGGFGDSQTALYSPSDGQLTSVRLPDGPQFVCMAASDDGQTVYYLDGNRLMAYRFSQAAAEERGILPNDGSLDQGFLLDGKWYAAVGTGRIAVCPIQLSSENNDWLTYYYDHAPAVEAERKWLAEGGKVKGITGEKTAARLTEMLLTGDDSIDVFIVSADSTFFRAARDRGYALPLSSSETLSEAAQALYPDILPQLSNSDGDLVAIPVSASFGLPALNRSAMERLGIAEEDVPLNWADFLHWLDDIAPALEESRLTLFPESISVESARRQLTSYVLSTYQLYFSENDDADARILLQLLNHLEQMDFARMGQMTQNEVDALEDAREDSESCLLYPWTSMETLGYLIDDGVGKRVFPLCMALSSESPAYLKINADVAIINPHTRHPEDAVQFIETLWACASPETAVSLQPENNACVEAAGFQENKELFSDLLTELQTQLENAPEADRQPILDRIDRVKADYDHLIEHRWAVNAETLQWLRAHDDHVVLSEFAWLQDPLTLADNELTVQYQSGLLTAERFVDQLNTQLRMMRLEQ